MARQVIVLGYDKTPVINIRFAMWLTTPANMVLVDTTRTSKVPSNAAYSWGITSVELTAIQNGTVTEQIGYTALPAGTTLANQEAAIQAVYTQAQTDLNASAPPNKFIGAYWDGTTWTAAP